MSETSGRPNVVLGVSGGIAAYKACSLLRLLTESAHDVTVVPTESALKFVGAATWEALSGKPVSAGVFSDVPTVKHVSLGRHADLVLVVPATADLMARAVHGRADDLLASTLLTATCPVVFAPAMHTEMWLHPATQANVATLRERGTIVLDPASGRLTGADTGPGRLPEPEQIFEVALNILARRQAATLRDLARRRVVVSAGGTREALDPVRYLGNRSSGKQGYALAAAAAARGAVVDLVAANATALSPPHGVQIHLVESAIELRDIVAKLAVGSDAVVMAAAPADFRPAAAADHKIKKSDDGSTPTIALVENPDILAGLVRDRGTADIPVLVGFAAETGDEQGTVLEHATRKLARKGCDLLVVNDVSGGGVFGQDDNRAVILSDDGSQTPVPAGSKRDLAHVIWDRVAARWSGEPT